jgi:SAM-dependent methyltransferase
VSEGVHVDFTELVPAFLRRGEQALRTRHPALSRVTFAPLDMNRPFGAQGAAPGSLSVVYTVNTLHVAHDLDFTLGEVLRAPEPGGRLVVSERVRSRARQPIESEFVFNLTETFRSPRLQPPYRPGGGFLTPGSGALIRSLLCRNNRPWRGSLSNRARTRSTGSAGLRRERPRVHRSVAAALALTRRPLVIGKRCQGDHHCTG